MGTIDSLIKENEMKYTHITIIPQLGSLDDVVNDGSEYNKEVRKQRLLAESAPELLAALRNILSMIPEMHGTTNKAAEHNAKRDAALAVIAAIDG